MTPQIYTTDAPAGFDLQILRVQNALAGLNFIDQIFGVAHIQYELRNNATTEDTAFLQDMGKKGTMKHERWYPQARKAGSDVDLTIGDDYVSRAFFLAKDPISTSPRQNEYDWGSFNPEIKQPFSLLFHCSVQKVTNTVAAITNYEQIKLSVLYALSQCPMIIVNSMEENIDNFWKEFSMTEQINGFSRYPFYTLRIEADAYYFAYPMNGSQEDYDPSQNWTYNNSIIPNTRPVYPNVN